MRVVAGVDSSTQSCTVLLRNADTGEILSVGRAAHPPTFPPVSEQDPTDWWRALVSAFASARSQAGIVAADIVAISVAAQCHGLIALDEADAVIRPAKLWNDTTSAPQSARLEATFGRDDLIDTLGSLPTAAYTITKIAWLAEHEPQNFARMASILLPHDWLTFRLTGNKVTDRSEASGTGYFNATTNVWDDRFLRWIDATRDWAALLPEVLAPNGSAGVVLPGVAAELGVSPDAVVGAGAGDQHASAIGLGARVGDLVFVLGTSGVVFGLTDTAIADRSGIVQCVANATGGFQPLICTLNSTKVTDAIGRLLGVDHGELSDLALAAERTADRPVFAAYLDGERTPNFPDARGVLSGLGADVSREQLALAAFEGVVLGLVRGQQMMTSVGVSTSGRLIAIGGGAKSPAYLQIIADFTGSDVLVTDQTEAVAAGAAVQAAAVLLGSSVERIRDEWAPDFRVAARPRDGGEADAVTRRYLATAEFSSSLGRGE